MKLTIDELDSITGWSSSDTNKIDIYGTNEVKEFIANDNDKSLMIEFKTTSTGAYVEKTFTPIDVTNYNYMVFSVHSVKRKNAGDFYNKDSFRYQVDFNGTMDDYMVPIYSSLTPVTLDITNETSIDRIRITSNTIDDDFLVLSHCVAVTDELPLDIFDSFKDLINKENERLANKTILIDTVTTSPGDNSITLATNAYLDRYTCVKIDDGANSEVHQLLNNDEVNYELGYLFDGVQIINSFTDANTYLYFPVDHSHKQKEIMIPGIIISGISPAQLNKISTIAIKLDSFTENSTVKERQEDRTQRFNIFIDIIARNDYLLAIQSKSVRDVAAREKIWINGKKYDIFTDEPSEYIQADDATNQLPMIRYKCYIELKEEIFDRVELVETTAITTTVNII